jgi:hypothetical protein
MGTFPGEWIQRYWVIEGGTVGLYSESWYTASDATTLVLIAMLRSYIYRIMSLHECFQGWGRIR